MYSFEINPRGSPCSQSATAKIILNGWLKADCNCDSGKSFKSQSRNNLLSTRYILGHVQDLVLLYMPN